MAETAKLTTRQLRAIPTLLAAKSYEAGCKKAKVAKSTFYAWMHDECFAAEFDRQRDEIVKAAFGLIAQNIEKAVTTLVGLLDSKDQRVKRLTANDIIGHYLKHQENKDLEERIQRIEERQQTQVFEDKRAKMPATREELEEALKELDEIEADAEIIQMQVNEKCQQSLHEGNP